MKQKRMDLLFEKTSRNSESDPESGWLSFSRHRYHITGRSVWSRAFLKKVKILLLAIIRDLIFVLFFFQVSFHASGNYLASSSEDGSLKLFDLLEARPIYDLRGHNRPVTAAQFSPKGDFLASGGSDNLVFLWKSNLPGKSDSAVSSAGENRPKSAKSYEKKIESVRKEIEKCSVLEERNAENKENASAVSKPTEKRESDQASRLASENAELKREVSGLKDELAEANAAVETLTETVILMEKRITLLEDQVRLSQSLTEHEINEEK